MNSGDKASNIQIAPAPDGGWGWTIVFASFMIHAIADGVTYTFGVFYVEFLREFGESRSMTSWVASILVGTTFCVGPVASGLTNKLGCRVVTIMGALLSTIGLLLSLAVPSVSYLFITIGLLTGTGFGLMYVPSIVSVSCYFEKRRAFATGIAVCGSGMGTFGLAPFTELLVDYYGWRGALMIIAGLVLNCVVFGALFRPLETEKKTERPSQQSVCLHPLPHNQEPCASVVAKHPSSDNRRDSWEALKNLGSGIFPRSPPTTEEANEAMLLSQGNTTPKLPSVTNSNYELRRNTEGTIYTHSEMSSLPSGRESRSPTQSGLLYHKDILFSGSLTSIPEYNSNPDLYWRTTSSTGSRPDLEITGEKPSWFPREISEAFMEMLDFSLMSDPIFLLFGASNFLTSIGFNVPYVYTLDRVEEMGIASKEESSFLLSIIGISNTIGRVILGYLSDRAFVNRLYVYNTCLVVCGLSTALSSLANSYLLMATYCAVFGASTGACVSITSVILVQLFGLDKLTNAFGLLLLFVGIACFIGPPITGLLFDRLRSYNPGFYLCGAVIILSGLLLFLVPCVSKRRLDQENNVAIQTM